MRFNQIANLSHNSYHCRQHAVEKIVLRSADKITEDYACDDREQNTANQTRPGFVRANFGSELRPFQIAADDKTTDVDGPNNQQEPKGYQKTEPTRTTR